MPEMVARGDLNPTELKRLDEVLAYHGIELNYTGIAESTPGLTFACLRCGSVGVSESIEARDSFVENYDPTCCGKTVVWHSSHKTLINPDNLVVTEVKQS